MCVTWSSKSRLAWSCSQTSRAGKHEPAENYKAVNLSFSGQTVMTYASISYAGNAVRNNWPSGE